MITFRQILKNRQESGETNYYSVLTDIFENGLNSWLTLLGQSNNTFNGIPHIKNVENHIDHAVPDIIKKKFSSTEIFLLLSSILLHDIGKIDALKNGKTDDPEEKLDLHSTYSCNKVINEWAFLKIPNEQLARWIAIVVCSHTWNSPIPGKIKGNPCDFRKDQKCRLVCENNNISELDFYHEAADGQVRLDWVAAILRLGDEVDNINLRTLPNWLTNSNDKQSWRKFINSISFDIVGRCIKLYTIDFTDEDWETISNKNTYRARALDGILWIEKVLEGWKRPLLEMGLNYEKVFIDSAKPTPTLYNNKSYEEDNKNDILIEPALNKKLLERIIYSMIRLNNSVIRKKAFSWTSLAAESRIHNIELVKLAVQRIKYIASVKNESPGIYQRLKDKKIISSYNGWHLVSIANNEKNIELQNRQDNENIIHTNIKELDYLLCPDDPKNPDNKDWQGGFYIPTNESKNKWFTPVIIIEGSSGDGKTSLMNQIACNLIRQGWLNVYYSLEQENDRIIQNMKGYGYFPEPENNNKTIQNIKEKIINLEEKPWYQLNIKTVPDDGFLIFPSVKSSLI